MLVSFWGPFTVCCFTVAIILSASFSIAAQAEGTFDLSFNSTGYRYEGFGGSVHEATAVAVQTDGKIIAVGRADGISGSGTDFAIVRYTTGGSLDPSFGTGGKVTTAIGPGTNSDIAFGVAIQPDGKIVVAGQADGISGSGTDFALVRYNSDGTLDASFGVLGKVTTPIGPGTAADVAAAVAIQPDGKIIAAGYADDISGSGTNFAIVRYDGGGTLDASFGTGGKATTAIGPGTVGDFSQTVAIQSDGKIVAAGFTEGVSGLSIAFALARYNADGTPDLSFDVDGELITVIGSSTSFDIAAAVAIQTDGKIVAAGFTDDISLGADIALARYNADGSLDTSFDTDGIVTTAIGPGAHFDIAQAVVIQPDGKIVAAGFTDDLNGGPGTDLAVVRYNANGSLDASFNADGKATIDLGGTEFIHAAAIYSGNRIAVAGGGGTDFLTGRIWLATLTTAADVTVSGRITDENGRAIRGARVTLTDDKGISRATLTNAFGYYRFTRIPSGATYILQATDRRYTFADPVRVVDVSDDLAGMDFVGHLPSSLPRSKGTTNQKSRLVPELR